MDNVQGHTPPDPQETLPNGQSNGVDGRANIPSPLDGEGRKKLSADDLDRILEKINSTYLSEAEGEDNELISSWTETLNIILTFGGLLSAVITAFLLFMQPDLKPDPNESTNQILLRILHRLDNDTVPFQAEEATFSPSALTMRCLAWWHTSLGCSLTSTFGALLSKLWVLHYQSNPSWADTEMKRSRLRESRYDGLDKWKMYAIVESLPVILQLSVFLFYLGLAESFNSVGTLFAITVSFAAIMGALFVITLLTGAFFPSCPYKSTFSTFANKAVGDILFWSSGGVATICGVVWLVLVKVVTTNLDLSGIKAVVDKYWDGRMIRRIVSGFEYGRGERSLVVEEGYSAGVLCWWLQAPHLWEKIEKQALDGVVGVMMERPVTSVMDTRRWKGGFEVWSLRVFKQLRGDRCSHADRLQADIVCHFMHHSPKADNSARLAIEHGLYSSPNYDNADVFICKAIRNGWSEGPVATTPLPVENMRPTTYSVYLRHQLATMCHANREDTWNHELLLKELPTALGPEYFQIDPHHDNKPTISHAEGLRNSLIDAISLTAIALVPRRNRRGIHWANDIGSSEPMDQLLRAVNRLSYFSDNTPDPEETSSFQSLNVNIDIESQKRLVALAISGTYRVFNKSNEELYDSTSWKEGLFAKSLPRLLKLGRTWWHDESDSRDSNRPGPGAILVGALHDWIQKLPRNDEDPHFMTGIGTKALWPTLNDDEDAVALSPDVVAETIATYAHPSTREESLSRALVLDYVLGLRFYYFTTHQLTSFLTGHILDDLSITRTPPPLPNSSVVPAPVIQQLIVDLRRNNSRIRQLSLSIIVKGKDIFLPRWDDVQPPTLKQALESCFDSLFDPNKPIQEVSQPFTLWDELITAIKAQAEHPTEARLTVP